MSTEWHRALACVVLPVCGHHFLPDVSAQEIVRALLSVLFTVVKRTDRSIWDTAELQFYNDIQTVFSVGIKGICLAWRLNHAPSLLYNHLTAGVYDAQRTSLLSVVLCVSWSVCSAGENSLSRRPAVIPFPHLSLEVSGFMCFGSGLSFTILVESFDAV